MSEPNRLFKKKDERNSVVFMDLVVELLKTVFHGEIIMSIQNFSVIQIERKEKIRLTDLAIYEKHHKEASQMDYTLVCRKIQKEFQNLEFGNIVVVIKSGRVVQVERTVKQRFQSFTGMDGEGI